MTIHDLDVFFEKDIRVITQEDELFQGTLTGFEDELDSSSGQDEIELDVGDCYIAIEIPDIKSVELIE